MLETFDTAFQSIALWFSDSALWAFFLADFLVQPYYPVAQRLV